MWTCPNCKEEIGDEFDSCWKCAGIALSARPRGKRCFKCGGNEITKGKLRSTRDELTADVVFRPDKVRFLTFTLAHGITLDTESYACLSCGTVWSQTDPNALRDFIRKHCRRS